MSRLSIAQRSISTAAAILVLIRLLSSANAMEQPASVSVNAASYYAAARADGQSRPVIVSSRLPWPAPVGHRQPRLADVPQSSSLSAWEREQHVLDRELDRKLVICRGC